MYKIIFLLPFLFLSFFSPAQEQESKRKNNAIFVELYQPIHTPKLREFYADEWVTASSNFITKRYSSYSIGLAYELVLKNNFIVRPRMGVSFLTISYSKLSGKYQLVNTSIVEEINYSYKQKHTNLFFGFAKRIELVEHFNLDFGIDIAAILYRNADKTYSGGFDQYKENSDTLIYREKMWWTIEEGKSYSIGIGPYIKPEYFFFNNLTISAELQMFFMYAISKSNTKTTLREYIAINPNQPGGPSFLLDETSVRDTKNNFREINWSRLSPLIRIGYRF